MDNFSTVTETADREQTTTTTNYAPANVEVDLSVRNPSIATHRGTLLTRIGQYENDTAYGDALYVI